FDPASTYRLHPIIRRLKEKSAISHDQIMPLSKTGTDQPRSFATGRQIGQGRTNMAMSQIDIRRRKDGSIDTEFYAALGNRERARVIRALLDMAVGAIRARRWATAGSRNRPSFGIVEHTEEI